MYSGTWAPEKNCAPAYGEFSPGRTRATSQVVQDAIDLIADGLEILPSSPKRPAIRLSRHCPGSSLSAEVGMPYDLTGKVKLVQEPQTFPSGFTKREVVVTVEDGKYPQDISLEFLQDKASLLDTVSEGQEIKVFFDIRGREYNGRYFNNLVGWKIEPVGGSEPSSGSGESGKPKIPADPESDKDYTTDWDVEDPPF